MTGADDDAFTVSLSYDTSTRCLSSLEECPIVGTEGDRNATRVVVHMTGRDPDAEYALMYDVAVLLDHNVRTSYSVLEYDSDLGVYVAMVPPEIFNNTKFRVLPVQLRTVSTDSDGIVHRCYSFNIIKFKVARSL